MISVGVVDDSAVVRSAMGEIIQKEEDMTVVGMAKDVYKARTMIMKKSPDVLTLDVEMPRMDGITFLEQLMKHQPMPVIMVSRLTHRNSDKGIQALEKGALGVVEKPSGDTKDSIMQLREQLIPKLRKAVTADFQSTDPSHSPPSHRSTIQLQSDYQAILMGASTGGVETLKTIFQRLKDNLPPILVVQHMPEIFTRRFSQRLNNCSSIEVWEAGEGNTFDRGEAGLAPGGKHLCIQSETSSGLIKTTLHDQKKIHHQRPAVDELFRWRLKIFTGMLWLLC